MPGTGTEPERYAYEHWKYRQGTFVMISERILEVHDACEFAGEMVEVTVGYYYTNEAINNQISKVPVFFNDTVYYVDPEYIEEL